MSSNPKVSIDDVLASLRTQQVPADVVQKVLRDLNASLKEEKADKLATPKSKSQLVCIALDPEGKLAGIEFLAYVLKIEESAPPQVALDRAKAAAVAFNQSRKGRKRPVKNLAETFEGVPRKYWDTGKEGEKTSALTKVPVFVQRSDNSI